jgi:hypothetical protein
MKRWLGRAARGCFGAGARGADGAAEFFLAGTSPSAGAGERAGVAVVLLVAEHSAESQGRAEATGARRPSRETRRSVFIVFGGELGGRAGKGPREFSNACAVASLCTELTACQRLEILVAPWSGRVVSVSGI